MSLRQKTLENSLFFFALLSEYMEANTFLTWMQEGFGVPVVSIFGLWEDGRSWTGVSECK